jgi:hypothetical protein
MAKFVPTLGLLSIGVAAHGNVETTAECLECLLESVGGDFELYIEGSPPLPDAPYPVSEAFMVSGSQPDFIGGFDIRYHGYFSDTDYGLRAPGARFRWVLSRRSFAWHEKLANFDYLDADIAKQKLARRRQRVKLAWQVFRETWKLDQLQVKWPGMYALPLADLICMRATMEIDRPGVSRTTSIWLMPDRCIRPRKETRQESRWNRHD